MDVTIEDLKKKGWHLSDEGLEICKEDSSYNSKKKNPNVDDIIKCALDIDLGEISVKLLPDDLNKGKTKEFNGPCVLQITKIRNVSAPKANEDSTFAPRMLQINFTDGHKHCVGLEHSSISGLSLDTAPGSKIRLNGRIELRNGFLLLDSKNTTLLGGKVESIYKKWQAAKEATGFARNTTDADETPPPFVPFGKQINYKYNTNKPSLQKSSKHGGADDENKEFAEQRQAAIAEVKKNKEDSVGKVFTSGPNRPLSEPSTSSSAVQRDGRRSDFKKPFEPQSKQAVYKQQGHAKVDEYACSKIMQMGFPRPAAVDALEKHDNNLDQAIDFLLSNGDHQQDERRRGPSRFARDDSSRGGRNSRRGGRGKGRFNRGRNDEEDEEVHRPSNKTTLFDFLENKISSTDSKKEKQMPEKREVDVSRYNGTVADDQLQEEYIMEYVKELSLVETGGSTEIHTQRNEESSSKQEKGETSGLAKYRGGGGDSKPKEKFDRRKQQNYERGPSDQGYSNRGSRSYNAPSSRRNNEDHRQGEDSRYDNPPRGGSRNWNKEHGGGRRNDRYDNTESEDHGRGKQNRTYEGGRGGKRDDRHSNEGRRDDYRRSNDVKRNTASSNPLYYEDNQPRSNVAPDSRGESGRNQNMSYNRKPQQERQTELPPRFMKKQIEELNTRLYQPPTGPATNEPAHSNPFAGKKGLTLGDTARQMRTSNESHSASTAQSNHAMTSRAKPTSSHSYQDQRQQNRPNDNSYSAYKNTGQPPQQRQSQHNVKWERGMLCLAKYWEDGQFYKASIEDVHPTQPTAVVHFIEYGNSEEVLFNDLKPDMTTSVFRDNGSYNGPTAGLEFTRGHKGPTRYPHQDREAPRDRRGPQRPSQSFYQPPVHR